MFSTAVRPTPRASNAPVEGRTAPRAKLALYAAPGETVWLGRLRGLLLAPLLSKHPQAEGVVAGLKGYGSLQTLESLLKPAVGQPVSQQSLARIQALIRFYFRDRKHRLVSVSLPPQDITSGVVTILVKPTRLDGEVEVDGNRWFSDKQYRSGLALRDGSIDTAAILHHVAWLDRNPYRKVTPELSPGDEPGTMKVALYTHERFPFRFTAGYDNTGTPATDDNRVFVSTEWGNAFGGVLDYSFRADPDARFLKSNSLNGTWWLRSGHTLTVYADYSLIHGDLPEPFAQGGTSWQVGSRYTVPFGGAANGVSRRFVSGFDFKSSDNNLLFGGIPVVGSLTNIVEASFGYAADWRGAGQNSLAATLFLSPGGLAGADHDADFEASQTGAKAEYAYATVELDHQQALGRGFTWRFHLIGQLSTAHLLSSEQMPGGGAASFRGCSEGEVYTDNGVGLHNTLFLPPIAAVHGLQFYLFDDLGRLWNTAERGNELDAVDLHSVGAGLSYQPKSGIYLSAAYGRPILYLNPLDEHARWHLSAQVSF